MGRRNGHPERPERPRAASGGGAEPSTCALSGGEALLSQGKASKEASHTHNLHTYRSEPFNRSRRKAVFEPVLRPAGGPRRPPMAPQIAPQAP